MENFLLSCTIVLPVCLMMAAGYFARRAKLLDAHVISVMNRLVFYLFLPALLFCNVSESDITAALDLKLIGYVMATTILNFALLYLLFSKTIPDPRRRGAVLHGTFRGNTALFGIPVAAAVSGDGNIAIVAVTIAAIIPLYNTLAVLALELCRGGKPSFRHILHGICTNPLILSVIAGLVFALLRLRVPGMIYPAVRSLADIAAPLSFVLLGASFTFRSAAHNRRALTAATLIKLIAMPLVWVGLAAWLGWRGAPLLALFAMFGPPTAVSACSMAEAMDSDVELTGEIIAMTSAFSLLTVFGWVLLAKGTGLF